jgi:hypothetical protein
MRICMPVFAKDIVYTFCRQYKDRETPGRMKKAGPFSVKSLILHGALVKKK